MANIPTYTRQVVQIVPSRPRSVPDYEEIGRGVQNFVQIFAQHKERQRKADEDMLKIKVDTALREQSIAYTHFKGGAAKGVLDDFQSKQEQFTTGITENISHNVTRKNIEIYALQKYKETEANVMSYQIQQDQEYREQVDIANQFNASEELSLTPITNLLEDINNKVDKLTVDFAGREQPSEAHLQNYRNATQDKLFSEQLLQRFKEEPISAVGFWAVHSNEIKGKVSAKVYTGLVAAYETAKPKAFFNQTMRELSNLFGTNNQAKLNYILNTNMEKKHGITPAQQMTMEGMYEGRMDYQYKLQQRKIQEGKREESSQIEDLVFEEEFEKAQEYLEKSTFLDNKIAWRTAINNVATEPNTIEISKLIKDIAEERITNHSDITLRALPIMGRDRGVLGSCYSLFDRMQAIKQRGKYTNVLEAAGRRFDDLSSTKASGDKKLDFKLKEHFMRHLRHYMFDNNLTPFDDKLWDESERLMDKSSYYKFMGEIHPKDYIPARLAGTRTSVLQWELQQEEKDFEERKKEKVNQPFPNTGKIATSSNPEGIDVEEFRKSYSLEQFDKDPWTIPGDTVPEKATNYFLIFPDIEDTYENYMGIKSIIEYARPAK